MSVAQSIDKMTRIYKGLKLHNLDLLVSLKRLIINAQKFSLGSLILQQPSSLCKGLKGLNL